MKVIKQSSYEGKVELDDGTVIKIFKKVTRDLISKYDEENYKLNKIFIEKIITLPINYTEQLLKSKDLRREYYLYENNW